MMIATTEQVGWTTMKPGDQFIRGETVFTVTEVSVDSDGEDGTVEATTPSGPMPAFSFGEGQQVTVIRIVEAPVKPRVPMCQCGHPDTTHSECIDFTSAHGCFAEVGEGFTVSCTCQHFNEAG
jgi:hypothetical protein